MIFVDDVKDLLPKTVHYQTLYDSLSHLAGERITEKLLVDTCWRLAGNMRRLTRQVGRVGPWTIQKASEWVPVQIIGAKRRRNKSFKLGWTFSFQVIAGSCCPMVIEQFWSDVFCHRMKTFLGFAKFRPSEKATAIPLHQFQHPTEFVMLRLQVLIDPALCTVSEPGFKQTRVSPSCVEWNKTKMKYRDRVGPGFGCPFKKSMSLPCFKCEHGYRSCRAGCHRLDYELNYCTICGKDAYFDPATSDEMCITCYDRRAVLR